MGWGIGGGEGVTVGVIGGVILARTGGPEVRIDVGEDAVAQFDGGEAFFLFGRDGAVRFQMLPDGFELVELVHVGLEAKLGVVSGSAGRDEELPVGGLEEEKLAAELLDDALGGGLAGVAVGLPCGGGAKVADVELGGIDLGVRPGGVQDSSRRSWCPRLPRSLRAS